MAEVPASGHEIRSVHLSPQGYLVVAAIDGLLVAHMREDGVATNPHWFDVRGGFTTIEPLAAPMAETPDGTVWLAGLEEMTSFSPASLLRDSQESTIVPAPRPWWQRPWVWLLGLALLNGCIWMAES